MSKPYDATLKTLLEESPEDWPVLAGMPRQPTEVIDADIATVTGAADRVLKVRGRTPAIVHVELQSGPDASLPRRIHVYNAILEHRHGLPVRSVVLLVSPKAEHSSLTGTYEQCFTGEPPYLTFHYQLIRVWREAPERFLSGGLGLLPLAPISAVAESELPGVIQQLQKRLKNQQAHAGELWTAVNVLLGLRYKPTFVQQLLEGAMGMKESTTYQAIKREGKREGMREGAIGEARRLLMSLGRIRWGPEGPAVAEAIEAINEVALLEELFHTAAHAGSWQELLASCPAVAKLPKKRNGSKKRNGKSGS